MKKKLLISFSGGRTSAFMTWWLLNVWEDRHNWDIIVVFANTGLEAPGTLLFVKRCAHYWNINIIWVEAVPVQSPVRVTKKGKTIGGGWWGVTHKIVDYFTASRAAELIDGTFSPTPFEEIIKHLGIPTTNAPFCSDQLKSKAIKSYMKSIGWRCYYTAIGIRSDEVDRVGSNYVKERLIYPLISIRPTTKVDIINWWINKPFDLTIHEDEGNCINCWKKDMKRLVRNAKRNPLSFRWWQYITDKYGHIQTRKSISKLKPPFNFYRGNLSPNDIFKLAGLDEDQLDELTKNEKLNGCSESCEAF